MKRFLFGLLACLAALALLLGLSIRAGAVSTETVCSLSVTLLDGEKVVDGGSLTIFRVADVNENMTCTPIGDFAGADLGDLSDPALPGRLAAMAGEGGDTALPEKGVTVFSGLKPGVYLVIQREAPAGYYPVAPFVVSLPVGGDCDGKAEPKLEPLPETPAEPVDITVKKLWSGDGDHPDSVTLGLFAGEEQVDSVKLSVHNQWTHTWENLDGSREYAVKELNVPKGYTPTYRRSGDTITVTNTATLIQTGQLNWPIPVLAICGLMLLMVGMALRRKP